MGIENLDGIAAFNAVVAKREGVAWFTSVSQYIAMNVLPKIGGVIDGITTGAIIVTLVSTAVEYQLTKRRFSSKPVFVSSTLRQLSSRYVSIALYILFWGLSKVFIARASRCAGALLGVAVASMAYDLTTTVLNREGNVRFQQKWFLVDILQDLILLILSAVNLVLIL